MQLYFGSLFIENFAHDDDSSSMCTTHEWRFGSDLFSHYYIAHIMFLKPYYPRVGANLPPFPPFMVFALDLIISRVKVIFSVFVKGLTCAINSCNVKYIFSSINLAVFWNKAFCKLVTSIVIRELKKFQILLNFLRTKSIYPYPTVCF